MTGTISKKKIYTVPEGTYNGSWSGNFCWLNKTDISQETFYRFETKHKSKKTVMVTVKIIGTVGIVTPKAKLLL